MIELSNQVLAKIKETIDIELLKRGLPDVGICVETLPSGKQRISIKSDNFQTTPVLFKEVWIDNFGGGIWQDTERTDLEIYKIVVPVHVSYKHFDMGQNGCLLFTFTCSIISDDDKNIYSVMVK